MAGFRVLVKHRPDACRKTRPSATGATRAKAVLGEAICLTAGHVGRLNDIVGPGLLSHYLISEDGLADSGDNFSALPPALGAGLPDAAAMGRRRPRLPGGLALLGQVGQAHGRSRPDLSAAGLLPLRARAGA